MEIFSTFFPCWGTKTSFSLVRELKSFNLGISPGLGASQAGWVLFEAIVCFCERLPFLNTVLSLLQGNEILKRGGRGRTSFSRSNTVPVRSNIDWNFYSISPQVTGHIANSHAIQFTSWDKDPSHNIVFCWQDTQSRLMKHSSLWLVENLVFGILRFTNLEIGSSYAQ